MKHNALSTRLNGGFITLECRASIQVHDGNAPVSGLYTGIRRDTFCRVTDVAHIHQTTGHCVVCTSTILLFPQYKGLNQLIQRYEKMNVSDQAVLIRISCRRMCNLPQVVIKNRIA